MVRRSKRAINIEMAKSGPCREFYALGYKHGLQDARRDIGSDFDTYGTGGRSYFGDLPVENPKPRKRKLNSWQKFVKANANKKKFKKYGGKLNLKKMGIAYRKTAAYKRSKK